MSLPTVSRALNNKSNVSPETRARVLRAAAELGYKLQLRASSTIAAKLNTIGVIIKRHPDLPRSIDPFNYAILSGIEDVVQQLNLNLMYASLEVDEYDHATHWPPMLDADLIDGLIVVGAFVEKAILMIENRLDMPTILVDAYVSQHDYDAVLIDNITGAKRAVQHLIDVGHSAIGLVGSTDGVNQHFSIQERRMGYLAALEDSGIGRAYMIDSKLSAASAYEATQQLLAQSPEITAIFGCNDHVARACVRAVRDLGWSVPTDVSVVGFDDMPEAREAHPHLTTMQVNPTLLGQLAVRHLYDKVAHNYGRTAVTIRVATKLILRESTAAPRWIG